MHRTLRAVALAGLLAAMSIAAAGPAAAHETRKVGPYEFTVGWDDEPTFTGSKNAVGLGIVDGGSGEPVNELGDEGLQVDVIFGDESVTLEMEPAFVPGVFGEEGHYTAEIAPTRAGEYTFHIHGSIDDTPIDEEFTSGPDTFNSPTDLSEIMFPAKDPSTAELAERLDRELPRVQEQAQAAAASVDDDVSSLRLVSYAALGVGLVALVIGLVMMVRASRSMGAVAPRPEA